MRDMDMRLLLGRHLQATLGDDTLIVHEFGVCNGQARVDVAAINGALHGWEIKSAFDTLARLEGQAEVYSQVLDYVTLVVDQKHLGLAVGLVPPWWGVLEVFVDPVSGPGVRPVRPATLNPAVVPEKLVRLLWRDELWLELSERGRRGLSRAGVDTLAAWLVEDTDLDELRAAVRHRLRTRPGWPSATQLLPGGD